MKHSLGARDSTEHSATYPQSLTEPRLTFSSRLTRPLRPGQINEVLEGDEAAVIRALGTEHSYRVKCQR